MPNHPSLILRAGLLAAFSSTIAGALAAAPGSITGPSSSQSPYLVRSQPGVVVESVLTAGDSVNMKPDGLTPYRLVGIPDGMGAFDNEDDTFTLLLNHELGSSSGIPRAHGAQGAFVSRWVIDKETLKVLHGEDLIQQVVTWNKAAGTWNPPAKGVAFNRFCSADLAPISAFYDEETGLGYRGRILLNGEESGTEGRALAHLMDGTSYELPWLGRFSHENSVAHPDAGLRTVVVGLDDSGNGQVYVYAGQKTSSEDPIEAAGLSNGTLYGVKVSGFAAENPVSGIPSGSSFTCEPLQDVVNLTGAELESLSTLQAVTGFQRPEDGAWDPEHPNDFYFVTTASFTGNSRLWRLRFQDASNPALGGTIDMLLNGTEGQRMMDNITVTSRGSVFIQEDPGNQPHVAKLWRYSIARKTLEPVAQHDPFRFGLGGGGFLTQDEESSGIIPMDEILGEGWFLLDVQAHYGTDTELVEGGQIVALHFPPGREK